MTGRQDDDYYSTEEVIQFIRSFTDGDLVKLERSAELWARALRGCGPEDLVQEVMVRLLQGSRRWPRGVSKEAFFVEAMRSCADQYGYNATIESRSLVFESETTVDDDGDIHVQTTSAVASNQVEILEFSQELEAIQKHFEGDEVALAVILCRAEGYSPEEARQEFSLTSTQYDSALTRIRRYVKSREVIGAVL